MAMGRNPEGSSSGAPAGRGGSRPRGNRPRYVPRRRVCAFCADKSKTIDFRDAAKLRRYMSERAKIEGRRKTATCAKHQRQMAEAIKRARHLAMLPYTLAHIRQSGIGGFRTLGGGRYGPPPERGGMVQPAPVQPAAQAADAPAPVPEAQVQAQAPAPQPAAENAAPPPASEAN